MPCHPFRMVAATIALALAAGCSAVEEGDQAHDPCAQPLQENLQRLVDLPETQWRFVVLHEPDTGDFIQFAWWGGVVVDLPLAALDAEQRDRATRAFDPLGAGTPVLERGPDGTSADSSRTFQHDFGRDTAAAARFGCTALRSIYLISEHLPLEAYVGGD